MKKASMIFALAVGLTAASWAGDVGVGASLGNTNYKTEYTSSSVSSNRFQIRAEGILPVAPSLEVDPYVSFYSRTDDGDWSSSRANDKTTEFGFGARAYYVTKVTEQFRLLAGGDLGLYFLEEKYDGQVGTDKSTYVALTLPLAAEYRIVPSFALRAAISIAGFAYKQESVEASGSTTKYNTTDFYLANTNATISIGAYYFF